MPPSKFEANRTFRRGVKSASFSLFTLASSCANAYFCAYAIIDFLTDQLVFLNMVTYILEKWFPLWGERAHSLKLFCMCDKRFEISKTK